MEHIISPIITIGCLSHEVRGTHRDDPLEKVFQNVEFRPFQADKCNVINGLSLPRDPWDTVGQRDAISSDKKRAF